MHFRHGRDVFSISGVVTQHAAHLQQLTRLRFNQFIGCLRFLLFLTTLLRSFVAKQELNEIGERCVRQRFGARAVLHRKLELGIAVLNPVIGNGDFLAD